jgi:hypothetical protein
MKTILNNAFVVTLPGGITAFLNWARRVYDRCQWCNVGFYGKRFKCHDSYAPSRDHIVPRVKKGNNKLDNIVLACKKCNEKRSCRSVPPNTKFYGPRWANGDIIQKKLCIRDLSHPVQDDCLLWVKYPYFGDGIWYVKLKASLLDCYQEQRNLLAKNMFLESMITPFGVEVIGNKVNKQKIAKIAYQKWLDDGRQHGQDIKYWLEAEKAINGSL